MIVINNVIFNMSVYSSFFSIWFLIKSFYSYSISSILSLLFLSNSINFLNNLSRTIYRIRWLRMSLIHGKMHVIITRSMFTIFQCETSHTIRNCEFSSTTFKDNHEITIYIKTKCTKIGEKRHQPRYKVDWEWCEPKEYKKIKPLKSINNVFNDNQNSTILY